MKRTTFDATFWVISVLLGAIASSVFIAYLATFHAGLSQDHTHWGEFGSLAGGILGPSVAILALVVLIRGIIIQRAEFEHAKKELTQTSQNIARQIGYQKAQSEEELFFRMLNLHLSGLSRLRFKNSKERRNITEGIDSIESFRSLIRLWKTDKNSYVEVYNKVYDYNSTYFGSYFRTLFRIFELIDRSEELGDEHAKIASAQITENEAFLLALNGVGEFGDQFKRHINRFGLLERLTDEDYRELKAELEGEYDLPKARGSKAVPR